MKTQTIEFWPIIYEGSVLGGSYENCAHFNKETEKEDICEDVMPGAGVVIL